MSGLNFAPHVADTPFIITTSLAKPDPKTRRLIRSHVMRGKNVGKFRNSNTWRASHCQSPGDQVLVPPCEGWEVVTPPKIASRLSLYAFGKEGNEPYVADLVYRAFTIVKPATYALQDITVDTHQDNLFCFTNLTDHPGILHSMVFAAQAFHDVARGHSYGPVAQLHLGKALHHLQKSLDNQKEAVELTTISVVLSLALAAVITGDLTTASKHMDGLRRIVELRGGLQSLGPGSLMADKARA
ncbi:hypothetical protein VTK56DRAFT_5030 [Thermocarpiscus australiensis]